MQFIIVISSKARNLKSETGLWAKDFIFLTAFGMTTLGICEIVFDSVEVSDK